MGDQFNPYQEMPDKAFWKRSVARVEPQQVDPVGVFDLRITPKTRVATAGSCFAQHIARHLQKSGFNYFVAEAGHPILSNRVKTRFQYGTFSARYGNIYTARQLRQLFERAYGSLIPEEDLWFNAEGGAIDPFRPGVQPEGFLNAEEMRADRAQHFAAVRSMFEKLDVFVFTLGLTECWESRLDGSVFPICPGVDAGEFDGLRHAFRNQDVHEVIDDMRVFLANLATVNPKAQVVLTVSPVPLMATARRGQHVLSATTYSKSVLRIAAESLRRSHQNVHYFPSFEIISGSFNRGSYYAEDLRGVLEDGVSHVMRLFLLHAAGRVGEIDDGPVPEQNQESDGFLARAQFMVEVECDESALDRT